MRKRWIVAGVTGLALVGSVLAAAPRVNASSATSMFTIGDGHANVGDTVEFWGDDWSTANTLSGGPAPTGFKGYAVTVVQAGQCSGTFTAVPGNHSDPPATLPLSNGQIVVLVTNDVTQSGPVIAGTFTDMATVVPNPGYGQDPGQHGAGTIVSLCSQSIGGGGGSG
jgi:hypothetical protein